MSHLIEVFRDSYSKQTTLGKLYITPVDGEKEYFCETLEDTVRPEGIKVKGHTAIAAGIKLKIDIRYSPKFRRDCVVLYTHKEEKRNVTRYWIEHNGVIFGEVMFHGGNDHEDTEGCPLICKNRLNDHKIQGTMEKPFTARIKELMNTCDVQAIFYNNPQTN